MSNENENSQTELILKRSIESLYSNQPNIFEFTSETGQSEWNLAHHLAIEIHKNYPNFDCDIDVIKVNYNRMRPDIILHHRGTHDDNFLVVEIKRDGSMADMRSDLRKIKNHWLLPPLSYKFGAVINLKRDKTFEVKIISLKSQA